MEIYYPAIVGSEKSAPFYSYSPSKHLPLVEQKKIPACVGPPPVKPTCCEAKQYMDHMWVGLPFDTTHGPYPVIIFIHGTSAFREYFSHIVEHWCSRGFVVVSADYPGITLYDEIMRLEGHKVPPTDQAGDTVKILYELTSMKHPDLQFLKGFINITNLGITGHSAGGGASGSLSKKYAQVVVPMAGGGTDSRVGTYSSLIIGGEEDSIVGGDQTAGYNRSPKPKRHLGIAHAGHETYCDLCWMAPKQGGMSGIGRSCGVTGSVIMEPLADQGCRFARTDPKAKDMDEPEVVWPLVRFATAGVFEETLLCDDRMTQQLKDLSQHFNKTVLGVWKEDL